MSRPHPGHPESNAKKRYKLYGQILNPACLHPSELFLGEQNVLPMSLPSQLRALARHAFDLANNRRNDVQTPCSRFPGPQKRASHFTWHRGFRRDGLFGRRPGDQIGQGCLGSFIQFFKSQHRCKVSLQSLPCTWLGTRRICSSQ